MAFNRGDVHRLVCALGCCPHAAIRADATINPANLNADFPGLAPLSGQGFAVAGIMDCPMRQAVSPKAAPLQDRGRKIYRHVSRFTMRGRAPSVVQGKPTGAR